MSRVRANLGWFVARLIPLGLLFAAVYALGNALAPGRALPLAFAWERGIPLVPGAIWLYLTVFLVFWVPLFVMDRDAMRALMRRYVVVTLAAGAVFLIFPTAVALDRATGAAAYGALYAFDAPYNAAPSLHVAYSVMMLGASARFARGWWRWGLLAWLALVVVSTWLTHQHQLVDIASGAALGWAGLAGVRPARSAA